MEYEFKYIDKGCPFYGNCKDNCTFTCTRYMEIDYLMKTSNIPKARQGVNKLTPMDCDYDAFVQLANIKKDIVNFVSNGNFLYLYGENVGSGKSVWSIKLMQAYLACCHYGNGFKSRAWFEYVPTLLLSLKDFYNVEKKQEIMTNLRERELVVLDDIGACEQSKYDDTGISSIVDHRYSNGLSTIFTGNLPPDILDSKIDVRVSDRVQSGYVLELKGVGMRGKGSVYKAGGAT